MGGAERGCPGLLHLLGWSESPSCASRDTCWSAEYWLWGQQVARPSRWGIRAQQQGGPLGPRCTRSEGWGTNWAEAFLPGPLGEMTRLRARDQAGLNAMCQGERLQGSRDQCWSRGPRSSSGPGRWPSAPDGSFHAGVLAARVESPEEPHSWPSSQLLSLMLFLLEDPFCKPRGPWPSSRRLGGLVPDTPSCLRAASGPKAGRRGLGGTSLGRG